MQVDVKANGLERRVTVVLPVEQVNQEIESRLKSLSRRVKVDGFRAGKVPMKVVERKWGGSVRHEVRNELLQSSFHEAVSQEKLRPAGSPQFDLQDTPEAGLRYTAIFEVYPEFEVKVPTQLKVIKPSAVIGEADIDAMVEKLRAQRKTWVVAERVAQLGDRTMIDFEGTINGNAFEGNKASGFPLVLGSGHLIPGFEEKLVGSKAGDSVAFDIQFPSEYRVADLAGQPVHFSVTVVTVEEAKLPEVDEDFIKGFGVQDANMEAFRAEVKKTMERELEQAIKDRIKGQVLDGLLESNSIDLPKTLIDEEINRIKGQSDSPRDGVAMEEHARRRVALGLIIAELIKKNQFKAEPEKVRAAVEAVAASYERPEEVVQWYYSRRDRLGNVEALLLEDQAVSWVIDQNEAEDRPTPFAELVGSMTAR